MRNLKAKLKANSGFTLIEMLVVVALIAILLAIAVPMVNSSMEKAREATDAANERSALGLAYVEIMSDNSKLMAATDQTMYYVISNSKGTLSEDLPDVAYGKGTKSGDVKDDHTGCVIAVHYALEDDTATPKAYEAGDVYTTWVKLTPPAGGGAGGGT